MPKMMSPNTSVWWVTDSGQRTVTDGATTSASTTVTSATGFTSADVGTPISGAGIPAGATIVSLTNATTVVISAAATATATGVSLTIGYPAFDPANPAASRLTAAADISCAIETGYKLGPTASDVDSSTTICDSSKVEIMTAYNYQGSLSFFREGDLADTSSAFYRAFQFFRSGTQAGLVTGYLVRRVGYAQGTAPAVGQRVDSFKFIPDNPQDSVTDKQPVKFTVTFHPQGLMGLHKALV